MEKKIKILIFSTVVVLILGFLTTFIFFLRYKYKPPLEKEQVNLKLTELRQEGKIKCPTPEYNSCDVFVNINYKNVRIKASCLSQPPNSPHKILMLTGTYQSNNTTEQDLTPTERLEDLIEFWMTPPSQEVIKELDLSEEDIRLKSLFVPRINSKPPEDFDVSVSLDPDIEELQKAVLEENLDVPVKTDYLLDYHYPDEKADIYKLEWTPALIGFDLIGNFNIEIEVEGEISDFTTTGKTEKLSDNKIVISGIADNITSPWELFWVEK